MLEKNNYIFKNYKYGKTKSILFLGYNFYLFYPKTKKYNIGVVFDYCGKPISELGMKEYKINIIRCIEDKLKYMGVKEIITLCLNCYYFLTSSIKSIRTTNIYEKLKRLNIGNVINKDINMFIPCLDKNTKFIKESISSFVYCNINKIKDVLCFGIVDAPSQ